MNCIQCGKELPFSALRNPNSYASKKMMHRQCARAAKRKADHEDYKRRKTVPSNRQEETSE